jgi:hypothetical protein
MCNISKSQVMTAGSRGRKKFRINKKEDTSFACL